MTKVGFIGLGAIGQPMAVHVARAFDTMVWNRTHARAEEFVREYAAHSPHVAARMEELTIPDFFARKRMEEELLKMEKLESIGVEFYCAVNLFSYPAVISA